MNKLINELSLKAEGYADDTDLPWLTTYTEKFAELVVQRTLDIVEAHTEVFQSDEAQAMVEHIKQSVKTDFGVE